MKKQGFVAGAAILMTANAISKILGAVFKIPITYILHEDGMAVFNVSFQVYIMFLSFAITGFPLAVSKTVSEAVSKNRQGHACNIVGISTAILCIIGALGSAVLYFGAEFFAAAMKEEKAVFAIRMIAPSVFLVAWGASYKSYFQGISDMIPTAASQVVEAIVKLVVGYMIALRLMWLGTEKTAGGAIFGVTAGELIASAMLFLMYLVSKRGIKEKYTREGAGEILKSIFAIALPILGANILSNLLSFADTGIIRTRLLDSGLSAEKARYLYGAFTGYAMTIFHLPSGILATLGVSILPVISGALASGRRKRAALAADSGIRLTLYAAIPFTVVMYMMSDEILGLIFNNTASAYMLKLSAPCLIMVCLVQITTPVLQASGRIIEPIIYSVSGMIVKVIFDYILIGMSEFNIYGTIIALNMSYFVIMTLNLGAVARVLGIKYSIRKFILKPAIATTMMCGVINLVKSPLLAFNHNIGIIAVCVISGCVYLCTLFLTGAINLSEITGK